MNTPVDLNGVCLEKHWLTHDFVCIRMEIIISSSLFFWGDVAFGMTRGSRGHSSPAKAQNGGVSQSLS